VRNQSKHWVFIFSLLVMFVIAGVIGPVAQVKIAKKPVKDPPVICNTNANCEYEELNTHKSLERQPCPDCLPMSYGQLFFSSGPQIAATARGTLDPVDWRPGRAIQIQQTGNPNTGGFEITWQSEEFTRVSHGVVIGDVDNDGEQEIAAIDLTVVTEGKGKNKKNYYHHSLLIYEENDWTGPPSARLDLEGEYISGVIDGAMIANVDYTDDNELIVFKSGTTAGHFEVYKIIHDNNLDIYSLTRVYYDSQDCENYILRDGGIWGIEVGNVDNDPENEILLARFRTTRPCILNFEPGDLRYWIPVSEDKIQPLEPEEAYENMYGEINFNVFRVGDVDGDSQNEIVAGGNNDRLMVWEYSESADYYTKSYVSPDLNPDEWSFTWALDLGNVDDDPADEIIVGIGGNRFSNNHIRIFDYSGVTGYSELALQPPETSTEMGLDSLSVIDFDNDGKVEIVTGQFGITIYHYYNETFSLVKIFNNALCDDFVID